MAVIRRDTEEIILRVHSKSPLVDVVPSAKVVSDKPGDVLVAVPHKPKEVVTLRQLGFKRIPDPMNLYYDYPGEFKPFDVQKQTAQFASMNPRCFILNSMGLGKTITALWAFDYLQKLGYVHKVLVVCPISVMERTWADEVFRSFINRRAVVLYGTAKKRKELLADRTADIYIINPDGQEIIADDLRERPDIDLIIIDEVALFRNSRTKRWKSMNTICNKQLGGKRRVWGMTGSPIPNSPEDAYGQVKLVNPGNPELPRSFMAWRERVMTHISQFRWEAKKTAVDDVHRIMAPAVRFSLDDAVDLPPQIISTRKISMSPEQKKAFTDMAKTLFTEIGKEGQVLAVNEAVKASKLLQIACGVVYGAAGKELYVGAKERQAVLEEVIEESEGKVIVFVPFSSALSDVKSFLEKQGHTVAVVDGSTSKAARDEIFYNFQHSKDPQVLVANPLTMSHGLTLIAATTIVWYGPSYSNEVYQQACARIRRPGQTHTTVIVHFVSSAFEEHVYRQLSQRQSTQGLLLQMVKENDLTVY